MRQLGSLSLGSHLKRLREERKLTLGGVENLSVGLGERVNKSYLFRVERGKTLPTLSRLRILAQVYQVKLTSLMEVLDGAIEEERLEAELGEDLAGKEFDELRDRGIDAVRSGQCSKAILLFKAARDRAALEKVSAEQTVRVATARHDLAIALRNADRLDLARDEAEMALEIPRLPERLLDKIKLNLADIYRRLRRPVLAGEILDGLLARRDDLAPEILAGAHTEMGSVLIGSNPREAAQHYRRALVVEKRRKNRFEVCKLLVGIGLAELKAGNYDRSMKSLVEAKELGRRHQFSYWLASAQTEIGRNLYFRGDLKGARSAFREANDLARYGDYYDLLFIAHYYEWRQALGDGNAGEAHALDASLRFFARRIQEPSEELEAYRKERP